MREFTLHQEPDGSWVVTSEKIPGYSAKGRTRQDAMAAMKQALLMYFPCGDCGEEENDQPVNRIVRHSEGA
ncbi:MAG: type II toxin-antitoxin system HicB family antitoxin [bacterium]